MALMICEGCGKVIKKDMVNYNFRPYHYHCAFKAGWDPDGRGINPEIVNEMLKILEHFCWKVENNRASSAETYRQARGILDRVFGEDYEAKKQCERGESIGGWQKKG